jgi:hypothetical protein
MDTEQIFTFKQRAEELMKALKRQATVIRQRELETIKSQLEKIGESLSTKK